MTTTVATVSPPEAGEKTRTLVAYLLNQVVFLEGKKGKGKSLAATAISYRMKEIFNKPVVVVGSKMGLNKETFGDFVFLDEKQFVQQLDSITQISNNTDEETVSNTIEKALKNLGVDVSNAVLVFDEAYKLFDARVPSDKLIRVFGYFVAQSRHYGVTIVLIAPNRDMIDKRVRRQIDWFGRVATTCKTVEGQCIRPRCPHRTTVRFVGGADRFKFNIFGPYFWPMYDSWAVVGFRQSNLRINNY